MPKAIMFVQSRPSSPDREDEYNDWYTNTHLPEVLDIPGITAARRFKASDVAYFQKFYDLFSDKGIFDKRVVVEPMLFKG